MKHFKNDDPATGEVHDGPVSECEDCNEGGEMFDAGDDEAADEVAEVVEVVEAATAPATIQGLPNWMPPAVSDTGAPAKPAGPSLVVGNPDEDTGALPEVLQGKLPPTSSLPAGARARWNVAEITGPDQTVFDVRRGDGPVQFSVHGTKEDAVKVIVALSLVDRVDRNSMRVAIMAKPELLDEMPDAKAQFTKSEEAKGAEFVSWLRKHGRALLAQGLRPWHGKVEGAGKPQTVTALLAKIAGGQN